MTSHVSGADDITWDLSDLYCGPDDPKLGADLDSALGQAEAFATRYRGTIDVPGGPAPEHLAAALRDYEEILERAALPSIYAHLLHAADVRPPAHGALLAWTQERSTEIGTRLLFLQLEWIAVSDEDARVVLDSAACRSRRQFLASARRYKPHTLSEPEERILEEKSNTGARAFARLFDELTSSLAFEVTVGGETRSLNESGVLALLYDHSRETRREAAAALTRGLEKNSLTITTIFNTLVQDHAVDDRLRAFGDPMDARHLANEIRPEVVEALMDACDRATDMVADYYELKRRLLGLDTLYDYDRYAPTVDAEATLGWEESRELVLGAYADFSPRMAEVAGLFFSKRWIDAEARDGKRGGAFSASTVPSVHPYVHCNFLGRPRDVMTVAHELGHGVHQYLSRGQGLLQQDTPLTLAETASVFGEMLVFDRLRRRETDPRRRLTLLCERIEDSFATVFRQIALTRFEQRLHQARRGEGELAAERISELWIQANRDLYGESVALTDDYRWWWAYIHHFIHSPFYCYAYGFGELLVLTLYDLYRRQGQAFVPRYLDLLAAGGSAPPEALLQGVGIDVEAPGFWDRGLGLLRDLVDEARSLAR
jgi:oligoendopeptidase F